MKSKEAIFSTMTDGGTGPRPLKEAAEKLSTRKIVNSEKTGLKMARRKFFPEACHLSARPGNIMFLYTS